MRTIVLLSFLASAASAADIPQGTHVLLRMENSVNTRTAKEGDFVYLRTAVPIANSGEIAVPAGSYVQGVVAEAKQSGRVKGRAQLAIRLETLTLGSGKVYRFSPHLSSVDSGETGQKVEGPENTVEQAPSRGQDAGRVAILAGSGAAIGGIADRSWKGAGIGAGVGSAVGLATVLLTRGKEVELRQGSTLDVVFDRPVSLE
jgi:type IV secretion system protein VirB10